MNANDLISKIDGNSQLLLFDPNLCRNVNRFCLKQNSKFVQIVNDKIMDSLYDLKKYHTKTINFSNIESFFDIIKDEIKIMLRDYFLEKHNCFVSGDLFEFLISPLVSNGCNDSYFIMILKLLGSKLKANQLSELLGQISDAEKNSEVIKILEGSPTLEILKFNEAEVSGSFDNQVDLLKCIARRTSSAKRLAFPINITLEHLKKLPAAMRFRFINFVLKNELAEFNRRRYYNASLNQILSYIKNRKKRSGTHNLTMDLIPPQQIEDLLFSVMFAKTKETTTFINRYSNYYNIVSGKVSASSLLI